jgi:Amt family ammonium transporter
MNFNVKLTGKTAALALAAIPLAVVTAAAEGTAPEPFIDFGNTAWLLTCSALVMFMTVPALALFYGGLVKRKNVLSVLMQCFILLAVVSLQWVTFGYTLAFGPGHGALAPFIGGLDWAFLKNVGLGVSPYYISQAEARVPHLAFVIFQCMFAVITPALIIGAFAERIKFAGFLVFSVAWAFLVYDPVAHWVWSADGWLFKMGALDFAGGTVVHINAGIAALITAIMIGKRKNLRPQAPHNLPYTMMGAAMLWFGWFGFNAGSGLAADGLAASAFVSTNTATAVAALTWAALDWIFSKRPTMLGAATGAVAGLVAITPAAGFVDITGAIVIGLVVSIICYFFVVVVKPKLGYDDSLDAFGVHGVGGMWGAIATGIFATPAIQSAYSGALAGNPKQLVTQLIAVGVTIAYSAIVTIILFKVVDLVVGVRVTEKEEAMGLDVTQHNERAVTIVE